jgi:hypothetical protein
LGRDPTPVDAVDGSQMNRISKIHIIKACLDNVLAIIKGSLYCHTVNVGILDRGHLTFLNLADPTVRKENDTINTMFSPQAINGGTARIPRSGPQDCQTAAVGTSLEEIFKKVAQHLQGNVLEGKGGTMKEFLLVQRKRGVRM